MATEETKTRMQVAAAPAEAARLAEAAEKAGFTDAKGGRSAWILSVASAAADDVLAGAEPVELPGKIAAQIAEDAAAEGLTVAQWSQRALMLTRAARNGFPARKGKAQDATT